MAKSTVSVPAGFSELSKAKQVRYVQDLWDQILDAPGEPPVLKSHLDLAEARLKAHRKNPARSKSAFAVLDKLAKRHK